MAGLLAATLGGCNHDPLLYTPDVDAGPRDLSPPPDLPPAACRTHQILSVPLTDIELVPPATGAGSPRVNSSLQLRVTFALRGQCDYPGDLNVRVMPGNATDFVVITMRAWRGDWSCQGAVPASRTVTLGPDLGLGNLNLLVSDGAPGGSAMLRVELKPPPMADCNAGKGQGAQCNADCECAGSPSLRCLQSGPSWRCEAPCSEDVDCAGNPDGHTFCVDGSVCGSCTDNCCTDARCRYGQRCGGAPARCAPLPAVIGGSCTCDSDCGEGRLCDQAHSCFVPCTTAADCGAPATMCDGGRCK